MKNIYKYLVKNNLPLLFGLDSEEDGTFTEWIDSNEISECLRFLPLTGGVVLRVVSSFIIEIERFVPLFFEFELRSIKYFKINF